MILLGIYIANFCYLNYRMHMQAYLFHRDIKKGLLYNFIAILVMRLLYSGIGLIKLLIGSENSDGLSDINRFFVILGMLYCP